MAVHLEPKLACFLANTIVVVKVASKNSSEASYFVDLSFAVITMALVIQLERIGTSSLGIAVVQRELGPSADFIVAAADHLATISIVNPVWEVQKTVMVLFAIMVGSKVDSGFAISLHGLDYSSFSCSEILIGQLNFKEFDCPASITIAMPDYS